MAIPIPDPPTILKFFIDAYSSWKGFKLVILGTTGVGKSTLWHYLQNEKIVPDGAVKKTLEIDNMNKFRLRSITLGFTKVGILATDLPGDVKYRHMWKQVIDEVKPDGIIFMLDNIENTDKGNYPKGFDPKRLEEHKKAHDFMMDILLSNPDACKKLQALALVVNKSDTFSKELGGYGKILKESDISPNIKDYGLLNHTLSTGFSCSAKYGDNVQFLMKWMVQNMSYKV